MTDRHPDARLAAARYSVQRETASGADDDEPVDRGQSLLDEREMAVEVAIQQAMRRGDFDGLPGAGQPIRDLGAVRDPNWWIRRKIEREGLTGLGPPALTLKSEDASLAARLDGIASEQAVREALIDFNRRLREARRQLQGGPPVLVEYRDVDVEVAAWRERSAQRRAEAAERAARESAEREAALAALPWRQRRRARRALR